MSSPNEETFANETRRDTWRTTDSLPFNYSSTSNASTECASPAEPDYDNQSVINWMEMEAPAGVEQPFAGKKVQSPSSIFATGSRWLGWSG